MPLQRGFVRKRAGTWTAYYRFTVAGARRQRSKGGFTSKADAQAYLNSVLGSMQHGEFVVPSKQTLRGFIEDDWLPMVTLNIRASTMHTYVRTLRSQVLPVLGDIPLQ